jgi:hypothetical protein
MATGTNPRDGTRHIRTVSAAFALAPCENLQDKPTDVVTVHMLAPPALLFSFESCTVLVLCTRHGSGAPCPAGSGAADSAPPGGALRSTTHDLWLPVVACRRRELSHSSAPQRGCTAGRRRAWATQSGPTRVVAAARGPGLCVAPPGGGGASEDSEFQRGPGRQRRVGSLVHRRATERVTATHAEFCACRASPRGAWLVLHVSSHLA